MRRADEDPRPPASLVLALAFGTQLGWIALAQTLELSPLTSAIGVLVIALLSAWWVTVGASLVVALTSFLVVDGFAEHQMGQLAWSGNRDGVLLLALLAACAVVAEIRSGTIEMRRNAAVDAARHQETVNREADAVKDLSGGIRERR